MVSQKNTDLKTCIKCASLLTAENWLSYLVKRSNYICTPCYRNYGKTYHKSDPEYNNKQKNRARRRRSAVIFSYGNRCKFCYEDRFERLTIDYVHGGGTQHRKKIHSNIIDHLYNNKLDLDEYQVLCYNCNCSKNIIYKDKYALRYKQAVIAEYGERCMECQEYRIERLTIDHKNNDGAAQRKKLKCYTGVRLYRWLIKNKFPKDLGLQILCYNCSCSKHALLKLEKEELVKV